MFKISIIYVNYYCVNDILNSIDTIVDTSNTEIIIVSNSLVDQQHQSKLKDRGIRLEVLDDNYGFGYACNVGADLALGNFLFFVNPDIIFKNDAINKLTAILKDERIAAVGPRHVTGNNKCEPSVKTDFSFFSLIRWAFPCLTLTGLYCPDKSQAVEVINGSAMLIKKTVFDEIGGFDTNFFLYWEENDLCLRIRKQGYLIYYKKEAIVLHKGQITTSKNYLANEIIKHRSQKYFVNKHMPELLFINRVVGSVTYLVKYIIAGLFESDFKVQQFKTLTRWYFKEYD